VDLVTEVGSHQTERAGSELSRRDIGRRWPTLDAHLQAGAPPDRALAEAEAVPLARNLVQGVFLLVDADRGPDLARRWSRRLLRLLTSAQPDAALNRQERRLMHSGHAVLAGGHGTVAELVDPRRRLEPAWQP
jgi:hypothetical protein